MLKEVVLDELFEHALMGCYLRPTGQRTFGSEVESQGLIAPTIVLDYLECVPDHDVC